MLTSYHHPLPLSRNLGTLTSWNPLGLFRPVMGLLYLYVYTHTHTHISFHLIENTIRPAEFAAVIAVDVTLLLGCDAVKFGIVKARAVAICRGGWLM